MFLQYWLEASKMQDLFRYFKFLCGGGLSVFINLGITLILTELFGLWVMLSFAIALGVEIIFQFLYHSVVTFKKRGKFHLFIFIILFISDLNWILVYLATIYLGFHYLPSIVIIAGIVSILNFTMNKFLVFKN